MRMSISTDVLVTYVPYQFIYWLLVHPVENLS